jgi:hypothetical protein
VPALQPCVIEPIWEQFSALLPKRDIEHPLGCHRLRIPDRTGFENSLRFWSSAAPTGGSLTNCARLLPCVESVMSGSKAG